MMEKIIKAAVQRGASDLHIKAGDVFRARINGKLVPLTKQRLTPDQTKAIALKLISSEEDRARIDRMRDFDCSWGMPGVGRFRVNVLRQRSSFMIVMRVIPFTVPTIESLRLPEVLQSIAESDRGLVLVSGVAGSNPMRSRTSRMVSEAMRRAAEAPSARISSTRSGSPWSRSARSLMGARVAIILSASTRLQSRHPHLAPRQFPATRATVSAGEKYWCK